MNQSSGYVKRMSIQKEDVNSAFTGHWQDFYKPYVQGLKNGKGHQYQCLCPFHNDRKPSMSIDGDRGLFHCFGCGSEGDPFEFYSKLKGNHAFPEVLRGIADDFNILPSKSQTREKRIPSTYDYVDEMGLLIFQVVRFEPKGFSQRRPDGKGGWIWNLKGARRVLYRLPEIMKADLVLIAEGEKDVDNIRDNGFVATTCPGGAEKWREEYNEFLAGRNVVLLPDNDDPGRKHVQKIAFNLKNVASSIKILELPNLPDKGDVSDWIEDGGTKEQLEKLIAECPGRLQGLEEVRRQVEAATVPDEHNSTEIANKLFPRGPFPWNVLPVSIADSLKQLARSTASSPSSLPSAALSIFSSVIGSTVDVSPKQSWAEPLIFWFGDIRPSGAGKTPAARSLCRPLYEAQKRADTKYKQEFEAWEAQAKAIRGEPPERARGYFVTDLTLEGLREDHSGHGGKVCVLDELSAFLSAQNQYKKKGSDRESWLCLHDGKPARIVRAGKSMTLSGARISIFGGIQPSIWRKAFSGQDGKIYLVDGTIYRFLPTYEGQGFYPLTAEAWSEENRKKWERLLWRAMQWADEMQEGKKGKALCLSEDAQRTFLDWRNELVMLQDELPGPVRGFIPKLVGYALRFAGVFYLMDVFSRDQEPGAILQVDDIKKGIRVSEFHLGHIIAAMEALTSKEAPEIFEVTDQVIHLARTLEALQPELDNGRLAIGYIQENFDHGLERGLKVNNSRLMGSLLRKCGLTITGGRYRANGKTGVYCLVWDKKTENFLTTTSTSPSCPQNRIISGSEVMEEESPQVHQVHQEDQPMDEMMDMMEEEKSKSIKVEPHLERVCGHDGHDGGVFPSSTAQNEDYEEVVL